ERCILSALVFSASRFQIFRIVQLLTVMLYSFLSMVLNCTEV
ncbi:hypothetical protein D046_8236B, partial [Vibrio parahaemolyticus V-223/04]